MSATLTLEAAIEAARQQYCASPEMQVMADGLGSRIALERRAREAAAAKLAEELRRQAEELRQREEADASRSAQQRLAGEYHGELYLIRAGQLGDVVDLLGDDPDAAIAAAKCRVADFVRPFPLGYLCDPSCPHYQAGFVEAVRSIGFAAVSAAEQAEAAAKAKAKAKVMAGARAVKDGVVAGAKAAAGAVASMF